MSLGPHFLPGVLAPEDCDLVLALAEAAGFAPAGLVGGVRAAEIRQAGIAWLDGPAAERVAALVLAAAAAANRTFGFDLAGFEERPQVARYAARGPGGPGHFGWHADIGGGPLARRRKLTLVVQLSDPAAYEGGALEIDPGGGPVPAPRDRGSAAVFPAFLRHRVSPVTRGVRHSLTTWLHGPPFR